MERGEGRGIVNGLDRGRGVNNGVDRERVDVDVDDRVTRTKIDNCNGSRNTIAATTTTGMRSDNDNGNCDTDNNMAIAKNADQRATLRANEERESTYRQCRVEKGAWLIQRGEGHGVDNGIDRGRVDVVDKMPAQSWTSDAIQ